MRNIAASIRTGATAFLNYEFRIIYLIVMVVTVVMGVLVGWDVGATFHIGATISSLAALVGMRIA